MQPTQPPAPDYPQNEPSAGPAAPLAPPTLTSPPTPAPIQPQIPMQGTASGLGNTPVPDSKKPAKKLVAIIAIVFIVLCGGVLAIVTRGKGNSTASQASNKTSTTSKSSDVIDRSDDTLDLDNLIDKQTSIKNQDILASKNQQINLSNGLSYLVTDVERNFVPSNTYLAAPAGKELIKVSVVVGNRDKSSSLYISSSAFKIQDATGSTIIAKFVSPSELPEALRAESLASGKQAKGVVIFQVTKDAAMNGIITEDKYTNSSSKEKVTIKSMVKLK